MRNSKALGRKSERSERLEDMAAGIETIQISIRCLFVQEKSQTMVVSSPGLSLSSYLKQFVVQKSFNGGRQRE